GVLAGGVAHDFNNLLVAMLGQTSLALAKMRAESPARRHVEKAVKAAERAADLTQKMLAYSGRGHFEVRPLNLNALIEENLHLFEVSIPKNVSLRSELADDLPLIEADAGQMQQVVMNLIVNGAEAIGEHPGRVLVVTGVEEVGEADGRIPQYTAAQLAPGRYVTLEVHDNGSGMDAETKARIFDPFFSTKQTGHGLGLAAVSGIMRGHKGGIRVYSEVGQGTTFKLLFPVSQAAPADVEGDTAVSPDEHPAGLILVIDDEAPVREAVTDILEMENIQVLTAANGAEGVAMYQKHMADIDLVILDLSMPDINGEETFYRLRRLNPDVKVLLSSGFNQIEATRHFSGKGLAGFMQKPYNAARLLEEVKAYL
ncbi:MAG TPA: response regulator, partial [Anaerolineae bacterium]|nr:response regulator [Anaerolineae bacterium]